MWAPRWNPEDPNEFLVLQHTPDLTSKLWRYHLLTQELDLVMEANFLFPAEWGTDGWILLSLGWPANIHKIKANGDSLTQLTFDGNNFGPIWNHDYQLIAYYHMDNETRIMDRDGIYITTMGSYCGTISGTTTWRHL